MNTLIVLMIGNEVEGVFNDASDACQYLFDWVCEGEPGDDDPTKEELCATLDKLEVEGQGTLIGFTIKLIEARDCTR